MKVRKLSPDTVVPDCVEGFLNVEEDRDRGVLFVFGPANSFREISELIDC